MNKFNTVKLLFMCEIELCFVGAGFHARPQIYGYRAREGTETLPYNAHHQCCIWRVCTGRRPRRPSVNNKSIVNNQ